MEALEENVLEKLLQDSPKQWNCWNSPCRKLCKYLWMNWNIKKNKKDFAQQLSEKFSKKIHGFDGFVEEFLREEFPENLVHELEEELSKEFLGNFWNFLKKLLKNPWRGRWDDFRMTFRKNFWTVFWRISGGSIKIIPTGGFEWIPEGFSRAIPGTTSVKNYQGLRISIIKKNQSINPSKIISEPSVRISRDTL